MKYKLNFKANRFIAVLLLFGAMLAACAGPSARQKETGYGVFIGVNPENTALLHGYQTVVIDAAYYNADDIDGLKNSGVQVYSYLNIGSIETFREDYPKCKPYILGNYENWPDEFWVDVSQPAWQEFIAQSAAALAAKGIDGFFIDNADVYYQYPTPEIFSGLVAIVQGLGQYGKEIIVNGGDVFVTEAVLEAQTPLANITGVNQECVFTNIDFETGELVKQEQATSQYYRAYLEQCAERGLAVYLTEYADGSDSELSRAIEDYCGEHGFACYIAPSLGLDAA